MVIETEGTRDLAARALIGEEGTWTEWQAEARDVNDKDVRKYKNTRRSKSKRNKCAEGGEGETGDEERRK